MSEIAILGAGGHMGRRVTATLRRNPAHKLRLIEPGERGRELIRESGLEPVDAADGLAGAEVVVFAVPDKALPRIAAELIPTLAPRTSLLFLDPAAVSAGRIPYRDDLNCYVMHPTHPPLYSLLGEADPAARQDYWGGGLAKQAIVFAIAWGSEETADEVERLAREMFAPVTASYRITVDQMALLEPALSETLSNGCVAVIKEGLERVIAAGVPAEAAETFMWGHFQIGIALIFERFDWRMSDGAALALREARSQLFKDDWYKIFDRENVMRSLISITGGE